MVPLVRETSHAQLNQSTRCLSKSSMVFRPRPLEIFFSTMANGSTIFLNKTIRMVLRQLNKNSAFGNGKQVQHQNKILII